MLWEIDFNSDEALYLQICNRVILGIASDEIQEGDSLPSVRQLADSIGINIHTVNKAYAMLRQEGFVKIDRRKGAVIALDADKLQTIQELRRDLRVILAKARCRSVTKEEMIALVEEMYDDYCG